MCAGGVGAGGVRKSLTDCRLSELTAIAADPVAVACPLTGEPLVSAMDSGDFIASHVLLQSAFYDADNLLPHVLHGDGVNVNVIDRASRIGKPHLLQQPLRKIVGHQLQTQPCFNEVVMDGMYAYTSEPIGKSGQRIGNEGRWQHHDIGCTKMERLIRISHSSVWAVLYVILKNVDQRLAQVFNRGELADVNTRQTFGQRGFAARRECPVRKIIGEPAPDEVMLLKGAECMLKNRLRRAATQRLQQLGKGRSFLPANAQKMLRGIEIERLL